MPSFLPSVHRTRSFTPDTRNKRLSQRDRAMSLLPTQRFEILVGDVCYVAPASVRALDKALASCSPTRDVDTDPLGAIM